jgi:hypothetical protein
MRDHYVNFWIGDRLHQYGPIEYAEAVQCQREIRDRKDVRYTYLANVRNPNATLVNEQQEQT